MNLGKTVSRREARKPFLLIFCQNIPIKLMRDGAILCKLAWCKITLRIHGHDRGVLRLHQASLFLMNRLSHLLDPASSGFFRQASLLGRPGGTGRFSGLRLESGFLDKLL